jgi:hypothetical protein
VKDTQKRKAVNKIRSKLRSELRFSNTERGDSGEGAEAGSLSGVLKLEEKADACDIKKKNRYNHIKLMQRKQKERMGGRLGVGEIS